MMRWSEPQFTIPDWAMWLIVGWWAVPILFAAFAPLFVWTWLERIKRQRFGPYVDRWQEWFAWRPVKGSIWDEPRQWFWLETIERRLGRYANWPTEYRPVSAAEQEGPDHA